ncbi:3-oxoacyl-[acyl-carrier-protein] synthase III C-terminal domain-containing protein [Nostoc sp.]
MGIKAALSAINKAKITASEIDLIAYGAAAAILKKGEPSNQILSYHAITNGKFVDCLKVSSAGTKFPVSGTQINDELNYLKVKDPQQLKTILSDIYLENYVKVIHKSLEKSGYLIKDVDFLLTNQVKKSLSKGILESLNLKDDQTFISLPEYGHLGAVDTIFGLAKTLDSKKIKSGNLVVLASSAAGFSWAALTVKY